MSRNSDGVKLQLKHLLLFLQYFYPLSVKVNAKTNKVDENRTANIIWLTQLFCTTSYGTYYLFNKLSSQYSTVQLKLIGFMQVDALLTKGLFAFIMAVYHRKTIVTLLNDILSLENVGRKLNFKFGTSNKALLMSILLYIINITFSAHRLSSPMYKGDLRRKMGYVAALLVDVLIPSTNFLFLSLLTLYIDYFKQLNSRLRCALLLDSPSKQLTAIKNVAIFHQKLAEIVNLSTRMLSPICISILCDCMLKITTYIYFFVSLLIYDYPLSYIATAIFYIIEAVIYMLLIVIPCEICMTYVSCSITTIWNANLTE